MNKTTLGLSILLAGMIAALCGCTTGKHYVIAATGTVIGLEVAQNPATEMYQAKLGYDRAELAIVPSNRASGQKGDANWQNGAADTTDVVMELNYANIFSLQQSGIYQRLAVGKNAVSQPGAMFMFAKGKDGNLDPKVAESVAKAISTIPEVKPDITLLKVDLAKQYQADKAAKKAAFDAAAVGAGYANFDAFLIDPNTTQAQIDLVKKGLQ